MMKRETTPQRRMRIGEGEDRQKVMDELMEQRHAAKKHRLAGGRTKGPGKRTKQQDAAFETAFQQLLQG